MTTTHQHSPRDLRGAILRGKDFAGADLAGANFAGADLHEASFDDADLRFANLRGADLRGADMRGADLHGADMRDTDLRDTDLRDATMRDANLSFADLRGANLRGATMLDTNLRGATGGVLQATGLHPYQATMIPTVRGWQLRVGCWKGTTQELRDLIAKDDGWPEAEGEQITARRPLLNALADLCDLHAANHQDALDAVLARWGKNEDNGS